MVLHAMEFETFGYGNDAAWCCWALQVLSLFVTFASRRSIARSFFFLEASGECLTDSVSMMLQPVFECGKKASSKVPNEETVCKGKTQLTMLTDLEKV